MSDKKGMGKLEVGGIALFLIIGFLILFQSLKVVNTAEKIGSDEACRASVQSSILRYDTKVVGQYEQSYRVNCPKNYIEVTDDKITTQQVGTKLKGSKQTQRYGNEDDVEVRNEEIAKLIARELKNCWKRYGTVKGSLHDANVDESDHGATSAQSLCFECSNIVFKLTEGAYINVFGQLESLKIIESPKTYYEYITGQVYEGGAGKDIEIKNDKDQWSVFIHSLPGNTNFATGTDESEPSYLGKPGENVQVGDIVEVSDEERIALGIIKEQDVQKQSSANILSNKDWTAVRLSVNLLRSEKLQNNDQVKNGCTKIY